MGSLQASTANPFQAGRSPSRTFSLHGICAFDGNQALHIASVSRATLHRNRDNRSKSHPRISRKEAEMIAVILSHDTALAYWSHPLARLRPALDCERAEAALQSSRHAIHVRALKGILGLAPYRGIPQPVDLLVPSNNEKRTTRTARYHYSPKLPPESIIPIGLGSVYSADALFSVYVCAPELVFVQMATLVGDIELLEIGYELCGDYSLQPRRDGKLQKRPHVTTPERIRSFIDGVREISGTRRAQRVSRWLRGNSRSPKESQIAILSTLATSRGGYQLPSPSLNEELPIPPNLVPVLGSSSIVPDLYWRKQGIVLEYDSNLEHSVENAGHDARKRTVYRMMGLEVVSLTPDQIFDRAAFENIMLDLERKMTKRRTPLTPEQLRRRSGLYRYLLFGQRRERMFISSESRMDLVAREAGMLEETIRI